MTTITSSPGKNLPSILAQSGVPVILAPNGTIATNGTVTLGTALPVIYASAWVSFPAGAVSGGAQGLYYCTFSSTTVGVVNTLFVDPATANFNPYIPTGSLTVATGSNAGYTQVLTACNLVSILVPGGSMGANGVLRMTNLWSIASTAGNKSLTLRLGGVSVSNLVLPNLGYWNDMRFLRNRGAQNIQVAGGNNSISAFNAISSNNAAQTAIDTSVSQNYTISSTLATATDFVVIDSFTIEVLYSA